MFDGYKITEKKSFSLNYKEKIALKEGEDDENCASSSAFSNFNAIIAPSCSHRLDVGVVQRRGLRTRKTL
jgi:hypothetical protein